MVAAVVALSSICGFAASDDEKWDFSFGVPGANAMVRTLRPAGEILHVGGHFYTIGGIRASNIASWSGSGWHALGQGLDRAVYAVEPIATGIWAGGAFHGPISGPLFAHLAFWDGTNWSAPTRTVGPVYTVRAGDRQIYVGGQCEMWRSPNDPGPIGVNIARWDNTNWGSLGPGLNQPHSECPDIVPSECSSVLALCSDGGYLYAAGWFNRAGELRATNIAKWDGTNWSTLGRGIGREGTPVYALASSSNDLYVGGYFGTAGEIVVPSIARYDGRNWFPLGSGLAKGPGFPTVYALAVVGTDLYVGGDFTSAGGVPANNIAKWNGVSWSALGSGVNGVVRALASNGTELFVGGQFTSAGGKASTNIALWHIPHSLRINRTCDEVTVSWPATGSNLVLESRADLSASNWQTVSTERVISGGRLLVSEVVSNSARFYRLRR
jgi:trimeric autotransporter adhesin